MDGITEFLMVFWGLKLNCGSDDYKAPDEAADNCSYQITSATRVIPIL